MAEFLLSLLTLSLAVITATAQTCGQSKMRPNRVPGGGQRIVGGVEAKPHSHPWLLSLQVGGTHFCGGSLIRVGKAEKSDIFVTAAHCLSMVSPERLVNLSWPLITAVAGAHDLTVQVKGQERIRIARIVIHEHYEKSTDNNDIAVVKLQKPVDFSTTVKPVCLPAQNEQLAAGTPLTAAGWGRTMSNRGMDNSSVLLQAGLPVLNFSACSTNYVQRLNSTTMLCAGYLEGGIDTCNGDSGGPLVSQTNRGFVLRGVTSFGNSCAVANYPGLYARVANYVDWINTWAAAMTGVKK